MTSKKPQRIYKKNRKSIPGWGYWGDFDEIEIGLSSDQEESTENPHADKLHYHKKGALLFFYYW